MKRVAAGEVIGASLFAVSAAALLVTQIAVGRHLARRALAQHDAAPAAPAALPSMASRASVARERGEADWRERDEPVAEEPAGAPATAAVPTVVQPPTPPTGGQSFDADAAKRALGPGLDTLPVCRIRGGQGSGVVEIVWTPDGEVSRVSVSEPFGDSPAGACIARRFLGARVPPFSGAPQAMRVSFRI